MEGIGERDEKCDKRWGVERIGEGKGNLRKGGGGGNKKWEGE